MIPPIQAPSKPAHPRRRAAPRFLALAAFLFSLFGARPAPAAERPNVVLILADDLGWKDAGYLGSRYYETPELDRLAATSTVFTRAYACSSCAPTRAALLTGQYSPRHGVFMVGKSDRGDKAAQALVPVPNQEYLAPESFTVAEALAREGYVTGMIGKWHVGDGASGPGQQGFQVHTGWYEHGKEFVYFSPYGIAHLPDGPPGEYLTDRLTEEAVRFIGANREKPFFLKLAHYAPHVPLAAKPEDEEPFRAKSPDGEHRNPTYAGMIKCLDRGVGRVLAELDRLDLSRRTYVVFLSDNGGQTGITAQPPLREGKGWLYEGGVRVPMLVRAPGQARSARCDVPVHVVDLYPTLLDWAGAKPPPADHPLDGVSLAPLLTDPAAVLGRDALFWHFPGYQPMKEGFRIRPSSMIVAGNWKLIEGFEDGATELYDLENDLGETRNLADEEPAKARELRGRLAAWRASVGAQLPTQPNPEYRPRK